MMPDWSRVQKKALGARAGVCLFTLPAAQVVPCAEDGAARSINHKRGLTDKVTYLKKQSTYYPVN